MSTRRWLTRPAAFVPALVLASVVGSGIRVSSNRVLGERIVGSGSNQTTQPANSANSNSPGNDNKTFAISGDISSLYPGKTFPLTLTLKNPNNFAISVTQLHVAIAGSGVCPGSALSISDLTDPVTIAKNASAPATLSVTMSATSACEDATWLLTYSGSAEKAK